MGGAVRSGPTALVCVAVLIAALWSARIGSAWAQETGREAAPEAAQEQETAVEGEAIEPAEDAPAVRTGAGEEPIESDGTPEERGRGGRLVSSGEGAAFGNGLGLMNLPQESDFEGDVPSFDLFWTGYSGPWWNYRFGWNHTDGRFEGFALSTNALYAAYVARGALGDRFDLHLLLGAAYHMATLQTPDGETQTASGAGPIFGAGMRFAFDSLLLGLQFLVLTHTADFSGVTVATGSNQLQLTLEFPLD